MAEAPAAESASHDAAEHPGPSTRMRVLAAALCAVCMVLAAPTYDLWWLGFVGWVPWLWAIAGTTPKRAFMLGWISGTLTIFGGFTWMTELLTRFAGFPWFPAALVTLLFALYQGLQWAIPAAMLVALQRRTGRSTLWLAPLCWVACEVLLPNIFPVYLGLLWGAQPILIQTADIGGIAMVSLCMLFVNAGLYEAWVGRNTQRRRGLIMAGATTAFVLAYGALRMSQVAAVVAERPILKVGVVQGNFGIMEGARRRNKPRILQEQQRVSAELQAQGAELLLWGETAYPFHDVIPHGEPRMPRSPSRKVHKGFDIPILFGAVTSDPGDPFPWNSAVAADGDGNVLALYDKVYLLAFGEYAPLVDPHWYLKMVPSASVLHRGDGPKAITIGDVRVGPLVCYEDILPQFVRETAAEGVEVLLNVTNDTWFGATREPYQHLGYALFRAVEHRRSLVRAVNTGVSVHVDPLGHMHQATAVTDPDVDGPQSAVGFVAEVPRMDPDSRTLFSGYGPWVHGSWLLALALLGWRRRED